MTAVPSLPSRPTLLTAGRWASGSGASASLRMRRHLGDTVTVAHQDVRLTGQLPGDSTGLFLDATMTALPSRRHRRLLGPETTTSTVRVIRPIGLTPGLWRAPAMVTVAGTTDLVKVDINVAVVCTSALRPNLDVTLTMRGDARVFGIPRSRGLSGPILLTVRAVLAEPASNPPGDSEPWAYAA